MSTRKKPTRHKDLQDIVKAYPSWVDTGKSLVNGEPVSKLLRRFAGDRSLRAQEFWDCCACGYTHVHVYEIFLHEGNWWLNVRPFADPESHPKFKKRKPKAKGSR